MNFGVLMRILITRMNTGQKVKILQTQDGGRHIENGFIAISQPRIIRCRWNRCPDAHFGSKNGHVSKKNKIFKIRHIENRLLAISQRFIVQLTRNLVHRSRITLRHRLHNQNNKFRKFKMAEGRYFENDFIAISQPRIMRFWWNLLCTCMFRFRDGHLPRNQNFAYSKWRTAAIWNIVIWLHLSEFDCPVGAKFGMKKLNHSQTQVMWST